MTVDVESIAPTVLVTTAQVRRVERVSPAFVRVALSAPAFADLGIEGFDTRFKLIFPGPTGELPPSTPTPEQWYDAWLAMADEVRSPMRTYTVRDVVEAGGERLLVVDLVVHEETPAHPQGPACRWALAARPGDEIQVIAPHAASLEYGGTEFAPGSRTEVLLVGDETAVPAVTRILADLGPSYTGHAFLEVPSAGDLLPIEVPGDIEVTWLVRGEAEQGRRLVDEVRRYLGLGPLDPAVVPEDLPGELDVEVWETPRYSAAGEDVEAQLQRRTFDSELADLYAWIAGETWLVKALRRTLVTELHVDRAQVAFMGYWREGVSMKS